MISMSFSVEQIRFGKRPDRRGVLAGEGGGFSLIELLVVLVVIALLVGLVLPALVGARRGARTVEGLSNLSQIGRAIHAYAEDYGNTLPVGWRAEGDARDTNWTTLINGHMTGSGMTDATFNAARFSTIFMDPNAAVDGGRVHFAAHPVLLPDMTRTSLLPYKVEGIGRTSGLVLVMDSCQVPPSYNANATAWPLDNLGLWDAANRPIYYDPDAPDNAVPIDPGPDTDAAAGAGHIRWRQMNGGAANFLFCDGHAVTMGRGVVTKGHIRPDG